MRFIIFYYNKRDQLKRHTSSKENGFSFSHKQKIIKTTKQQKEFKFTTECITIDWPHHQLSTSSLLCLPLSFLLTYLLAYYRQKNTLRTQAGGGAVHFHEIRTCYYKHILSLLLFRISSSSI